MMTGGSEEDEVVVTPRKRKATSKEENGPAHIAPQPAASSERKRGRPRKASIDVTDSVRRVPKGILTPSKNKAGRPRKSVAFGEAGEVDLGFKDLPAGGSKKSSAEQHVIPAHASDREPEEDVYSEEADDIACAVCSGLDSKKKNPIIICEN
jgi:origin recognition complex subunit 4